MIEDIRIIAPIMIWNPVPFLVDVFEGKKLSIFFEVDIFN